MNKLLDTLFEIGTAWYSVVVSLLLLAGMSYFGGVFWGAVFWIGLAAWLGICELVSFITTKKTLTQHWRALLKDPERSGFAKIFILSWWLLFGVLAGHLLL